MVSSAVLEAKDDSLDLLRSSCYYRTKSSSGVVPLIFAVLLGSGMHKLALVNNFTQS